MTVTLTLPQVLWAVGGLLQLVAMLIAWRYTGFMARRRFLRPFFVVFWPLGAALIGLVVLFGGVPVQ